MKCTLLSRFMTLASLTLMLGCSQRHTSADVKGDVDQALNQAGLKSVNVSQDRDKGVITLTGDVLTEAEKQRAEEIAKSMARSLVVANEIGVRPSGFESEAKKVDSSLDAAIEKNFEALLIAKQPHGIRYSAKNGVITLSGDVGSIERRNQLEQFAASVPNVKQVINELQIKEMKATSRK
jgi:hyperosmotically inducible periplasmic protein